MTYKHFSPKTDPKIDWERVDHESLRMLDEARAIAGIPFRVTSTYRAGPNQGAHGETPCTAFDLGYRQHKETREWVEWFRSNNPGTFQKGRGKATYNALRAYFYGKPTMKPTPDGIRIILSLLAAGFPRIGIQLGPGNEHIHVDASPSLTKKTGKVVFIE